MEQSLTVVYNGAKHLEDTIRSVINQIYPNVEYIIIDGGSTDGTIDIIKKYEDYIDYWVSEPDKGIYDAMNKGINISFGEWLNMLNSGDSYYNFMVIENIFLKEIDMDIYGIAGNWVCDYKGNIILYLTNSYKILEKPGWHINHQAFFYRKITHKILGLYSIDYRIASDHETVPKIHTVILSEAKNLIFSFQVKKSKKEILRTSSSGQQGKVNLQKFWNSLSDHEYYLRLLMNKLKIVTHNSILIKFDLNQNTSASIRSQWEEFLVRKKYLGFNVKELNSLFFDILKLNLRKFLEKIGLKNIIILYYRKRNIPRVRNSEKLEKSSDEEPLVGRGL